MFLKKSFFLTVILLSSATTTTTTTNTVSADIENDVQDSVVSGDDLVAAVARNCLMGTEPTMTCLRERVLLYVNNLLGVRDNYQARGLSDKNMDEIIARRLKKFINSHEFKIQLPKFLFEEAILTFTPSKGFADFNVDFPDDSKFEDRSLTEARGHLKKKLLLPLLLLLKLKIKALTPILLLIIGIKAVKAFIMSKLSLLLVIGFILLQLFKKGGMPMAMMPAAMATEPPPAYGPPQAPATYGPPAPSPDTTYGSWEPTTNSNNGNGNGNTYARWDSHNLAYNAHQPEAKTSNAQQPGV